MLQLNLKKQHRIQSTPKFFDSNRDGLTCLCNNICFVFIAGIILFLEFHCVVFFFITYDLCVKQVKKDNMVPDLLILPPSTDLHNHPLVTNGSVFMQVRVCSSLVLRFFLRKKIKFKAPSCDLDSYFMEN